MCYFQILLQQLWVPPISNGTFTLRRTAAHTGYAIAWCFSGKERVREMFLNAGGPWRCFFSRHWTQTLVHYKCTPPLHCCCEMMASFLGFCYTQSIPSSDNGTKSSMLDFFFLSDWYKLMIHLTFFRFESANWFLQFYHHTSQGCMPLRTAGEVYVEAHLFIAQYHKADLISRSPNVQGPSLHSLWDMTGT